MITEKQRQERNLGLGASDMPIVMGESTYMTRLELYNQKLGIPFPQRKRVDEQLRDLGNRLEDMFRAMYAVENNVKILAPVREANDPILVQCDLVEYSLDTVVHPLFDFIRVNLDGFIPEWNAVHEIKMANEHVAWKWGTEETDAIPFDYLIQIGMQTEAKGADMGKLSAFLSGHQFKTYHYAKNDEFQDMLITEADKFWHDHVLNKIPPEATLLSDLRILYPAPKEPLKIQTTPEIALSVAELKDIKSAKSELEKREKDFRFKVESYMKTAEYLVDEQGKPVVTYIADKKGSRRFIVK